MSTATANRSTRRSVVALVSAVGLGVGGLATGAILLALVLGVLVIGFGVELTPGLYVVLSLTFIQGVGCFGVALTYIWTRPALGPAIADALDLQTTPGPFHLGVALPDLRDLAVVAGGYVAALGAAMTGGLLVAQLPFETGQNQGTQLGMENPEVLLLLIPASLLIIGPGEELLFRGVVQGRLRERFGPAFGILIPSLVFAGIHWFAITGGSTVGNLLAVTVLVLPALVFGISYEYTDNVAVPALIHGVYNATLFTGLYAVVRYSDELQTMGGLFVGSG